MYGTTLMQRMERQRRRNQHKAKLRQIAERPPGYARTPGTTTGDAGFDNAPPRGFASLAANEAAKRYKRGRELLLLDIKNDHFLRRIVKYRHEVDGEFNRHKQNWERTRTKRVGNTPKVLTSLNVSGRRRDMLRIVHENKIMLNRLRESKTSYPVHKWMDEYEKNEYIRKGMSKHVPNGDVPEHLMRAPGESPGVCSGDERLAPISPVKKPRSPISLAVMKARPPISRPPICGVPSPRQTRKTKSQIPESSHFEVRDEHIDTFLRALFRKHGAQTKGYLSAEDIRSLMRNVSRGEPTFDSAIDDEVVTTFASAMDKDGDGLVSMEEMVEFFKVGMSLSKTKGQVFAGRSPMHGKIWRVFGILKLQLQQRARSIHDLFTEFSQGRRLESASVNRMLKHIQVTPPPTDAQLGMFVNALDGDGDGSISRDEMMGFCNNGMTQSEAKRKAFAARSQFHAHLVSLFVYLEGTRDPENKGEVMLC